MISSEDIISAIVKNVLIFKHLLILKVPGQLVPSGMISVPLLKLKVCVLAVWLNPDLHLHCTMPSVPLISVQLALESQGGNVVEQAFITEKQHRCYFNATYKLIESYASEKILKTLFVKLTKFSKTLSYFIDWKLSSYHGFTIIVFFFEVFKSGAAFDTYQ